jgi:hypothetical protein
MSLINRQLIEQCLIELGSRDDQLRLWKSTGAPEVSSFSEALEQLFTDSGLDAPLHAGKTGLGKECELCLNELEKALMSVNAHQSPDTLIDSPEMDLVRTLAIKTLAAFQTG